MKEEGLVCVFEQGLPGSNPLQFTRAPIQGSPNFYLQENGVALLPQSLHTHTHTHTHPPPQHTHTKPLWTRTKYKYKVQHHAIDSIKDAFYQANAGSTYKAEWLSYVKLPLKLSAKFILFDSAVFKTLNTWFANLCQLFTNKVPYS